MAALALGMDGEWSPYGMEEFIKPSLVAKFGNLIQDQPLRFQGFSKRKSRSFSRDSVAKMMTIYQGGQGLASIMFTVGLPCWSVTLSSS